MEKARMRFVLARSLNILAYLIIIIATYTFSSYEYYWFDFLFETSYGLCITFANVCATAALIIGFFFRKKGLYTSCHGFTLLQSEVK